MPYLIRDAERRNILQALAAENVGDWVKIASEINYDYNEIYFWFLISSEAALKTAVPKVMRILNPIVTEREGAEFNVTFIELSETQEIDWETIDDETLRRGDLDGPPGRDPRRSARHDTSVFDRPDYIVPASQEPI